MSVNFNTLDKLSLEVIIKYCVSDLFSILCVCKSIANIFSGENDLKQLIIEAIYSHLPFSSTLWSLSTPFCMCELVSLYKAYISTNNNIQSEWKLAGYHNLEMYGLNSDIESRDDILDFIEKIYDTNMWWLLKHGDIYCYMDGETLPLIYHAEKNKLLYLFDNFTNYESDVESSSDSEDDTEYQKQSNLNINTYEEHVLNKHFNEFLFKLLPINYWCGYQLVYSKFTNANQYSIYDKVLHGPHKFTYNMTPYIDILLDNLNCDKRDSYMKQYNAILPELQTLYDVKTFSNNEHITYITYVKLPRYFLISELYLVIIKHNCKCKYKKCYNCQQNNECILQPLLLDEVRKVLSNKFTVYSIFHDYIHAASKAIHYNSSKCIDNLNCNTIFSIPRKFTDRVFIIDI